MEIGTSQYRGTASAGILMVVRAVTYHETFLMCGDTDVTNTPLCIHQSPQIINQLDGQF